MEVLSGGRKPPTLTSGAFSAGMSSWGARCKPHFFFGGKGAPGRSITRGATKALGGGRGRHLLHIRHQLLPPQSLLLGVLEPARSPCRSSHTLFDGWPGFGAGLAGRAGVLGAGVRLLGARIPLRPKPFPRCSCTFLLVPNLLRDLLPHNELLHQPPGPLVPVHVRHLKALQLTHKGAGAALPHLFRMWRTKKPQFPKSRQHTIPLLLQSRVTP